MRVYAPMGAPDEPLPVIMWIHGGGWVLFDIDTYDASCRGLANRSGAVVLAPEYRRAPEARRSPPRTTTSSPPGIGRSGNAPSYGGDPARMAIGGESVGATMAAATCLQLAESGEPRPRALVCVYPVTTRRAVR